MKSKNCKKCGTTRTGRNCLPCRAAYMREYNKDPVHRAKKRACDSARYQRDLDKNRARSRANAHRDREQRRGYFREYYQQHADELKRRVRTYAKTPQGRLVKRAHAAKRRAIKRGAEATALSTEQVQAIFAAWNHCCAYCGEQSEHLELDHFVPIKRGGQHVLSNLVPACRGCNSTKHAKDPWEFLAALGQ